MDNKERAAIRQIIDKGWGAFSPGRLTLPRDVPGVIKSRHFTVDGSETSGVEKRAIPKASKKRKST